MKNAKRLKKLAIRSLLDSIVRALYRQALAAERGHALYERSLALQERQLELSEKSFRATQEMAHISKQNYADRLLAAIQQSTRTDAADD